MPALPSAGMKPRTIAAIVLALAAFALGAWMWFGTGGSGAGESVNGGDTGTGTTVPTVSGDGLPVAKKASEVVSPTPPPPVPVTSSVVPGMPLVRTTPTPQPRPGAVAEAAAKRAPARIEPLVEGKAEMEQVRTMLRDFRTRLGQNPVGSNAEIMKAIMGGNSVRATLGPPQGQSLNEDGELVDRWGKPYFFHQLSKDIMEIHSAGPDGRMWTTDDLVTK